MAGKGNSVTGRDRVSMETSGMKEEKLTLSLEQIQKKSQFSMIQIIKINSFFIAYSATFDIKN